jgi:hypothetical protein
MDMDLLTDLRSELAFAFIVERKHGNKIAPRDAVSLIDRVTTELQNAVVGSSKCVRSPFERPVDNSLIH